MLNWIWQRYPIISGPFSKEEACQEGRQAGLTISNNYVLVDDGTVRCQVYSNSQAARVVNSLV